MSTAPHAEAHAPTGHAQRGISNPILGMILFITSEIMFFSGLFAAYFSTRAANQPWPPAPFKDILDYLNHDAVDAGFAVTEGETEEHDAEANWKSDQQVGRWAIRESGDCPGEAVIQVFAAPPSS